MRTVDFYEVVSLVAEAVEKKLMDGKHISKARMEELKETLINNEILSQDQRL